MNDNYQDYKKVLRNFHQRINDELTILLYHGVTNIKSRGIENYSRKHISQDDFYSQMLYLRNNCNVISIDDYLEIRKSKECLPPKSVIITFDDGFKNNYTVAAPILADLGLPSVFYYTSGVINTNIMFWVDIIEDCLNCCKNASIRIELDQVYDFSIDSMDAKIIALKKIKEYAKNVSNSDWDRIVNDIQNETGVKACVEHSENYEKITWNELKRLYDNSLFTVGGHSMYHNILSYKTYIEMEEDIRSSIDLLETNLKSSICHFAYPEGEAHHYNNDVIDVLRKYGILCSPTAIPGLNSLNTDPFHLRRIMVGFNGLSFPFYNNNY